MKRLETNQLIFLLSIWIGREKVEGIRADDIEELISLKLIALTDNGYRVTEKGGAFLQSMKTFDEAKFELIYKR